MVRKSTTLKFRFHVGADGTLELRSPAGVNESDVDVTVTIDPAISPKVDPAEVCQAWRSWVSKTAGSISDPTFQHTDDPQERVFGAIKGRVEIADDFDALLPSKVLAEFEK